MQTPFAIDAYMDEKCSHASVCALYALYNLTRYTDWLDSGGWCPNHLNCIDRVLLYLLFMALDISPIKSVLTFRAINLINQTAIVAIRKFCVYEKRAMIVLVTIHNAYSRTTFFPTCPWCMEEACLFLRPCSSLLVILFHSCSGLGDFVFQGL